MRKILTTGFLIVLSIGILILFFKWVVADFLAELFRPLTEALFGNNDLNIIVTIVFLFLMVLLFGFLFTRDKIKRSFLNFLKRKMAGRPTALVEFAPESYFLTTIIKKVSLKKLTGETWELYILYGPSSPTFWNSGIPIMFVRANRVIPLNLSYAEVYGVTTTYGRSAPDSLEEIEFTGTD